MSQTLNSSIISNYRQACKKIIRCNRPYSRDLYQQIDQSQKEVERLSFKDIQNITKTLLKDKKAHEHNLGVLQNIKGKMYCLKLGEVSNFKEFSHYFYTSQYRRKFTRGESTKPTTGQAYKRTRKIKQLTTQISENTPFHSIRSASLNAETREMNEKKKIHEIQSIDDLEMDNKLKQKMSKFMQGNVPLGTKQRFYCKNKIKDERGQKKNFSTIKIL